MSAHAFVVYDARVVFAVDLAGRVIESAELFTNLDDHRDTALTTPLPMPLVRKRLEALAREIVERDPSPPLLRWSIARWSPVAQ